MGDVPRCANSECGRSISCSHGLWNLLAVSMRGREEKYISVFGEWEAEGKGVAWYFDDLRP